MKVEGHFFALYIYTCKPLQRLRYGEDNYEN